MKPTYSQIEEELEKLKAVLRIFIDGASLETIGSASGLDLELRTLQRRLASLVSQGQARTTGIKRSTRYYPVFSEMIVAEDEVKYITTKDQSQVYLSVNSQQILASVSQPIAKRRAIGYDRKFLESYKPNFTGYLTKEEKEKLAKTGKTNSDNQPAGTYAREILNRLLIDLSWNSSRLEGNTYSLLDTERLIAFGEVAEHKSALEAQMIINHKEAIEFLVQSSPDIGFNRYTILNLHGLLSNNLLPNPAASGRLRTLGVSIGKSVFTPLAIPQLIEAMFNTILEKTIQIKDPFEQAFFLMVQLPYLQPFDDVNKRVSRLAANISLNRHNLSPLSFVDVPNDLYTQSMLAIYELNKVEPLKELFMWAYERSALRYAAIQQSLGDPDPFKLRYRNTIRTLIADVISQAASRTATGKMIEERARLLPLADRSQFVNVIETELLSLHEGNFARYFVSPAEFAKWRKAWKR
ncbi:Fic family protein [Pseudobacter ginsenosidimutans]|uniref:Fic/DOC family protein n=1 Tax=Pseudobacter ginsenosidimutans TaxID=661488 RepID=A0A4Q7N3X7_9BACT|nr:Fic family protein [Pseudobacter ginsenosidimutans]RZS75678.1 Fic/DOC family protein [Pseudobacter ginsenosidimutans]